MPLKKMSTPEDVDQAFQDIYNRAEAVADDVAMTRETLDIVLALHVLRYPEEPERLILEIVDQRLADLTNELRAIALATMVFYDPS